MNIELKPEKSPKRFFVYVSSETDLRNRIRYCQMEKHIQQVAFSTYHNCLTQVCFTCEKVSTSIRLEEEE